MAVSGHFLHGVRSVDRYHELRGDLESPAFHGTDFEGLDPERAAVHLRLSLQVVLTNLHPEVAIVWISTRRKTYATFGRIPEVASMSMPANLHMPDPLPLPGSLMMMPGMEMVVGMMIHGALVMMTGALVTYGTLQKTVLRLTVLTHSKEEVRAKEKERVVRKEKDDT